MRSRRSFGGTRQLDLSRILLSSEGRPHTLRVMLRSPASLHAPRLKDLQEHLHEYATVMSAARRLASDALALTDDPEQATTAIIHGAALLLIDFVNDPASGVQRGGCWKASEGSSRAGVGCLSGSKGVETPMKRGRAWLPLD